MSRAIKARDVTQEPVLTNGKILFLPNLKELSENERGAIQVSYLSLYQDNSWNLSKEFSELPESQVIINFEALTLEDGTDITMQGHEQYLSSVKEYCYSLLVDPPPSRPKWSTCCRQVTRGTKRLLSFMFANRIENFSDLGPSEIETCLSQIAEIPNKSGKPVSDRTLASRVKGLSWLHEQSEKLSDGLKVWPFGEYTETEWAKVHAQEVIQRGDRKTPDMPDSVAVSIVRHAMDDINQIGLVHSVRNALKRQAKTKHRKGAVTGPIQVKANIKHFSWIDFGFSSASEFKRLEVRINTACYILVAMFSGMRFHEIVHLKFGRKHNWLEKSIQVDHGIRNFYFLISKTNKLEPIPRQYLWQTVPFVREVLEVAEQCNAPRNLARNPFLFPSPRKNTRIASNTINSNLKKFIEFHEIKHNGKLWSLATHQFRKKFARIMIRQGMGLVELQDQLKHYDIEMTKGYGDLNLYAELQQEKFILSSEKYEELLAGTFPIIGGGAYEVMDIRKRFLGMTTFERNALLADLPKKALIEQTDDGLCMYRPDKAMCGGDRSNCRPADCNNSVMPATSLKRTLTWRKSENNRMLDFFAKQPMKAAHLLARNQEIDKLLIQLNDTGGH